MRNRAVILDRDGTVIVERHDLSDPRLLQQLVSERNSWRTRFEELAAVCQGYDDCAERCGPRCSERP